MKNKEQTKYVLNAVRIIVNDGTAEATRPVPDTEMNKATLGNCANLMLDGSIPLKEDDTEEILLELKGKI